MCMHIKSDRNGNFAIARGGCIGPLPRRTTSKVKHETNVNIMTRTDQVYGGC